jgi:hypothetical protein
MASAALEALPRPAGAPLGRSWRLLVFARIAADGGATRSELAKDLAVLAAHRLSPAELRAVLDEAVATLLADGHVIEQRSRCTATPLGVAAGLDALGGKGTAKPARTTWPELRDIRLVALALGLAEDGPSRLRQLSRPDGLRAAILVQSYQLSPRARTSPAKLRSALAAVALRRAFGNSIKGTMDAGQGLSAKAGRVLAGQLARKPRDFGTDARLIAALAAEAVGSPQVDADALRAAILRRFVSELLPGATNVAALPARAAVPQEVKPATGKPMTTLERPPAAAPRPLAASRPDLAGFVAEVQVLAGSCADGWPGNRKAYISDVWAAVQAKHPGWGLTEIEFKSMLAEAHRTGHIVLANADLKDRRSLPRVQQSALTFKNTVLHFVRVVD